MTEYEKAKRAHVAAKLRQEFTKFFVTMTTETAEGWPKIDDSHFVDALADSLLEMGKQRGLGVALLQTLVHELQDRVNQSVTK